LAAERTRAALAAYRGGSGTLIGVLDARRAEIDARIERLRVEMETAALWAQLEYLIAPEHDATAALHGNDRQEARQ
jgi:outer membrane protein TolC